MGDPRKYKASLKLCSLFLILCFSLKSQKTFASEDLFFVEPSQKEESRQPDFSDFNLTERDLMTTGEVRKIEIDLTLNNLSNESVTCLNRLGVLPNQLINTMNSTEQRGALLPPEFDAGRAGDLAENSFVSIQRDSQTNGAPYSYHLQMIYKDERERTFAGDTQAFITECLGIQFAGGESHRRNQTGPSEPRIIPASAPAIRPARNNDPVDI